MKKKDPGKNKALVPSGNSFLLYITEDGNIRIQVNLQDATVWLTQAGGSNYFDELVARIRDIRSSEKVFWRKVLDIYATSIAYSPNAVMTALQ